MSLAEKYVFRETPENAELMNFYHKLTSMFWTVQEIDLSKDVDSFRSLSESEQMLVYKILSFFAASDLIVNDNIATNFKGSFPEKEVDLIYTHIEMQEWIHVLTYGRLVETYSAGNAALKEKMFHAVDKDPYIRKKAAWAVSYLHKDIPLSERILAFAMVESIFFSGLFSVIFWFKKRGLMPGLVHSNELIAREELGHCEFAAMLYRRNFLGTLSRDRIETMLREAIAVEHEFIDSMFSGHKFSGLNETVLKQYICFVADWLLSLIREPPLYNVSNPFPWMANLDMEGKTNFFEKKVSEYRKDSIASTEVDSILDTIDSDDDDF